MTDDRPGGEAANRPRRTAGDANGSASTETWATAGTEDGGTGARGTGTVASATGTDAGGTETGVTATETEPGGYEAPGLDTRSLHLRPLRLGISLVAVFGYALVFGAAVAAVAHLLGHARSVAGIETALAVRVGGGGALLLPAAAFLFLALYDDSALTCPAWPGGHPPLADSWLFAVGASGVVAVALANPDGAFPLWEAGWLAAGAAACVGLPLWLGLRCLQRPSWVLGAMSELLGLLVAAGALVATMAFPVDELAVAAAVAVVGTTVPYFLAAASPGPDRLAARAAALLERLAGTVRGAVGRT